MSNSDKIIIALDTYSLNKAKKLVKTLFPRVKFFKIGLEMINTGQAPELIKYIHDLGGRVFYDIKLNDIPNTVARSVRVISSLGVWGFTIHGSSGSEAIREAVKYKGKSKVIGITILTSFKNVPKNKIIKFTRILSRNGVDGFVCSVRESSLLKKFNKIIITPGIRPVWADKNEQRRTATPKKAIKMGADYIVLGRPIIKPPKKIGNSIIALSRVIEEIEK